MTRRITHQQVMHLAHLMARLPPREFDVLTRLIRLIGDGSATQRAHAQRLLALARAHPDAFWDTMDEVETFLDDVEDDD